MLYGLVNVCDRCEDAEQQRHEEFVIFVRIFENGRYNRVHWYRRRTSARRRALGRCNVWSNAVGDAEDVVGSGVLIVERGRGRTDLQGRVTPYL
jgi:hypothetical protein